MNLEQWQSQLLKCLLSQTPAKALPTRGPVDVYMKAYRIRLVQSLRSDFPRTAAALGKRFQTRALKYLQTHPSRYSSLAEVGRDFAHYLAHHSEPGDPPALAELARVEWAFFVCRQSQYALPHASGFESCAINPHQTRLALNPSLNLIESPYSLVGWLRGTRNTASRRSCRIVAWNSSRGFEWKSLPPRAFRCLDFLQSQKPSFERFTDWVESQEIEPDQIAEWLNRNVKQGVIVGALPCESAQFESN